MHIGACVNCLGDSAVIMLASVHLSELLISYEACIYDCEHMVARVDAQVL